MRSVWPVARREYLERVRSKAFLIATVIGPVLMGGLMVLPGLVMSKQRGKPLRIAVLDATGALQGDVAEALARERVNGEPRFLVQPPAADSLDRAAEKLRRAVLAGRLDGYLHLPPGALERSAAEYYGKNVSNVMDLRLLNQAVEQVFVARRLAAENLNPARIRDLTRKLDFRTIRLSERGAREDRGATFLFSVILMMMLYVTILMWGQAVMTGVIEEKTSRVVEVMASSVSPFKLFAGKLLGVGGAGLTQFLVWTTTLAAISVYGASALDFGGEKLPEVTPLLLACFSAFFLLGYFLYAALYAAIGAAVNTIQEAQNLVFPVLMPLIAGVMFFPAVIASPDSTLSTALSLIPLLSPLLMFLRITVLTPPAWQIVLSMLLTALTIAGVTWAASRIYRVGILMYGKRPTFPEILRWARHS